MIQKYTEEELITLETNACLPEGVDLTPFCELVVQVKELLRQLDEINPSRRRLISNKPKKPKQPKEIVDEDGWTTAIPVVKKEEEELLNTEEDDFEEPKKKSNQKSKQHTVKIKSNASKISSGKSSSGDSENIAITQVSRFNAFDALASESEDDE